MIRYRCDMCGRPLPRESAGRYVVRIEAFAAEGPLEITAEDLARNHREEIRRVVEELSRMPLDQIEDQVYRAFRFDLCEACHAGYLSDPLGRGRSSGDNG